MRHMQQNIKTMPLTLMGVVVFCFVCICFEFRVPEFGIKFRLVSGTDGQPLETRTGPWRLDRKLAR